MSSPWDAFDTTFRGMSRADDWEPTGSPLVQKRRRPDGSYETRRTPGPGRETGAPPADAAPGWAYGMPLGVIKDAEQNLVAKAKEFPASLSDVLLQGFSLPLQAAHAGGQMADAGRPDPARNADLAQGRFEEGLPPVPALPASAPLPPPRLPGLLGDVRESIKEEAEQARERYLTAAAEGGLPPALAAGGETATDVGAMALDPGIVYGLGRGLAGGLSRETAEAVPRAAAARFAETTPEEAALLARRAKVMSGMPATELPREVPHVGPVGLAGDEAEQLQRLGLRAPPGPAGELAQRSLAIGEKAAAEPASHPFAQVDESLRMLGIEPPPVPAQEAAQWGALPDQPALAPHEKRWFDLGLSVSDEKTPDAAVFALENQNPAAWDALMHARNAGDETAYAHFLAGWNEKPMVRVKGWRYGAPPESGLSFNTKEGLAEKGVSIMGLRPEEDLTDGSFALFNGDRPKHVVEGWLTGWRGADGEPLLVGVKDHGPFPVPTPAVHPVLDAPDVLTRAGHSSPPPVAQEIGRGAEPNGLTTGTKHAVTRAERAATGLPEVERLARSESGTWEEAKALYEQDPGHARTLAHQVAEKPRPLSPVENDLLLHDRMHLTLDYKEALAAEAYAMKAGDQEGAALAGLRRQSIAAARDASDQALDRAGTEWGRAGRARQKLIAEDYSALTLDRRYTVANGGAEAPAPVRQKLAEISARLEEAQVRAAAAEERAMELEAQRVVAYQERQGARVARGSSRGTTRAGLDAQNDALTKDFAARASTPRAGLDPELAGILAKKAKNRIQAGVTNLQDLVDGIYTEAKPFLADLEPRDVRDVIAGSGPRAEQAARQAATGDLPRLRREARVLNALEDVRGRLQDPRLAPDLRGKLETEAQRWEAEAAKLGPGRGPLSDPERLGAAKKRAGAAVSDLEQQLASGEIRPRAARAPLPADEALHAARAEVARLRRQADRIIAVREAANRTGFEKAMDWTAGWGRFLKLSGLFATPQKLLAAVSTRALILRPIEELAGAGVSKLPVVTHFAAEAPIEGGGSLSAIAKSYAKFFSRESWEEAKGVLRHGEGAFDLAAGKDHFNPGVPEWMDYPGRMHGAIKAPAKVSAYYFAMEKQAGHLLKTGEGEQLLNPLIQRVMDGKARAYAYDEIYMGDHRLVERFNRSLGPMPNESPLEKMSKTAVRTQLPIVKVPTNFVTDVTRYAFGLPKSATKMGRVISKGRKALADEAASNLGDVVRAGLKLSAPGEAELIMRQLKKGLIGAPLFALASAGLIKAGGYFVPGQHRRATDLQPGEIEVGDVRIPHMVLHQGAFEIIQSGNAVFREKDIAQGLSNAFWGNMEQVPFYETTARAVRDARQDWTRPVGEWLRGMSIPPDVQRLARVLDQRGEHDLAEKLLQEAGWNHIDARRRKARGGILEQLGEEEMLGIPGLRQKVR